MSIAVIDWDTNTLIGISIALVVAFLSKPLSKLIVLLVSWFADILRINLVQDAWDSLVRPASFLIAAGAIQVAARLGLAPGATLTLVDNLLESFAVAAVFSALHGLVGPISAQLYPETPKMAADVGRDWIEGTVRGVVLVLGVAAILRVWGVDIGSALTGVGVFGAALALAAQDFVRNMVAGMSSASERRFKVGDWIEVEGLVEGIVEGIELRSTRIRRFDSGVSWVPNSDLSNATLINFTKRRNYRVLWTIGIRHSATLSQLEAARGGIETFLRSSPDFVDTASMPVRVRLEEIGESDVKLMIYVFTATRSYDDYLLAKERLVEAVKREVEKSGARFSYPGRLVDTVEAPLPAQDA